jgi:Ca2+-binding RTX toxin-like protein
MDGGKGSDTADYENARGTIFVELAEDGQCGSDSAGDTLISIENVIGSKFQDFLSGNSGDNILEGGAGGDELFGGGGRDTASYARSSQGVVANLADASHNTGDAAGDIYIGISNLWGTSANDQLTGDSGDNVLEGGGGGDILNGGAGNDTVSYEHSVNGVVADLSTGTGTGDKASDSNGDIYIGIENLRGSAGEDFLTGDANDNVLEGGAGFADFLNGGAGSDTASYEHASEGVIADLEQCFLNTGDAEGDTYISIENLRGSAFNDTLTGDFGDNILEGGAGADTLDGGDGIDTASYAHAKSGGTASLANSSVNTGDAAGDTYANIENLAGSAFNDVLIGDAGANGLTGGAGNDILVGGAGADALDGGAGIDTASYENAQVAVTAELSNPAMNLGDAVGDTYTSIENLRGSAFDDVLAGDLNNNELEGGAGADVLVGDLGTDTASYAHAGAGVIASLADASTNTGDAAGDRYISVENLRGSAFADTLTGDGNNNVLEGGAGADHLDGGNGTDTASYEHAAAGVTASLLAPSNNTGEAAGDTYTSIENLRGSAFDDTLIARSSGSVLEGGAGADHLVGGAGSDTASYEHASSGVTVDLSSTLFANTGDAVGDTYSSIENITGSAFNDVLVGNDGTNLLQGGAGDDLLIGGKGLDALNGGAGNDTVSYVTAASGVSASLASGFGSTGDAAGDTYGSIENLTGSRFADTLAGNSVANILDGGGGNDILSGGAGNDTFVFRGAVGNDTISDFVSGQDVIEIHDGLFANANAALAAAHQVGADVVITIDQSDSITLHNFALANLHASDFHIV